MAANLSLAILSQSLISTAIPPTTYRIESMTRTAGYALLVRSDQYADVVDHKGSAVRTALTPHHNLSSASRSVPLRAPRQAQGHHADLPARDRGLRPGPWRTATLAVPVQPPRWPGWSLLLPSSLDRSRRTTSPPRRSGHPHRLLRPRLRSDEPFFVSLSSPLAAAGAAHARISPHWCSGLRRRRPSPPDTSPRFARRRLPCGSRSPAARKAAAASSRSCSAS